MALVRWEPMSMNRLLTTLFDTPTGSAAPARRWVPAMDLAETDEDYVLRADLPGVDPAEVAVELEGRVLSISGERRSERTSESGGYLRVERGTGSFRRSLTLPAGVDGGAIAASFDQGVLTVRIPKPAERKPQRIAIAVDGGEAPAIEGSEAA
jgi:HSP20 family protein